MTKYHINPRSGQPGLCTASVGSCPFGGIEDHHLTIREARKAYEGSMLEELWPSTSKKKRPFKPSYHEIELIDGVEHVWLYDSGGEVEAVRYDVIDTNTVSIYRQGQCLAFAVEAHRETGWPIVGRLLEEDDGDEPGEVYDTPVHFWVQAPNGSLLDMGGFSDLAIVEEELDDRERLVISESAEEIDEIFGPFLSEQNFEAAQHFLPHALERAKAIDEGRFDPEVEWPVNKN